MNGWRRSSVARLTDGGDGLATGGREGCGVLLEAGECVLAAGAHPGAVRFEVGAAGLPHGVRLG